MIQSAIPSPMAPTGRQLAPPYRRHMLAWQNHPCKAQGPGPTAGPSAGPIAGPRAGRNVGPRGGLSARSTAGLRVGHTAGPSARWNILRTRGYRPVRAESGADPRASGGLLEAIIEWDVIEFQDAASTMAAVGAGPTPSDRCGGNTRLGKVVKVDLVDGVEVEPLQEQEEGVWVADEQCSSPLAVPGCCIIRIVPAEFSQRQDPQGPGNPHGEHAHDIWLIEGNAMPCSTTG